MPDGCPGPGPAGRESGGRLIASAKRRRRPARTPDPERRGEAALEEACCAAAERYGLAFIGLLDITPEQQFRVAAAVPPDESVAAALPDAHAQGTAGAPLLAAGAGGECVVIPDVTADARCRPWLPLAKRVGAASLAVAPVLDGGQVTAVVVALAREGFKVAGFRGLLEDMTDVASPCGLPQLVRRARTQICAGHYGGLGELEQLIAADPGSRELMTAACDLLARCSGSSFACVASPAVPSRGTLQIRASAGPGTIGAGTAGTALDKPPAAVTRLARKAMKERRTLELGAVSLSSGSKRQGGPRGSGSGGSAIAVPLLSGEEPWAVLVVCAGQPRHYFGARVRFLERAGRVLALALAGAEEREQRTRYHTFYTALARLDTLLWGDADVQELYQAICDQIARVSPQLFAGVAAPGEEGYRVKAWAGSFLTSAEVPELLNCRLSERADRPGGSGAVGRALRAQRTIVWSPSRRDLGRYAAGKIMRRHGISTLVGIPIFRDELPACVLVLGSRERHYFTPELIQLAERFAGNLGKALLSIHHRKMIRHQAVTDALTGLPNRTLLSDRLRMEVARARRAGAEVALAVVTLDKLQAINDRSGQAAGDQIIVTTAQRLRACLREQDTLARFAGDKFVAVLPLRSESAPQLVEILRRLAAAITKPILVGDESLRVTASIGAAVFPEDADGTDDLQRRAELAMSRIKQNGGNDWGLFEEATEQRLMNRIEVQRGFADALRDGHIDFYLQPMVDLDRGRVSGAELLARWETEDRGVLSPASWLPVVENNPELVAPLGRHAMQRAMEHLVRWNAEHRDFGISVNLSARHLLSNDFLADLDRAIEHAPRLAPLLGIEVTETAVIEDFGRLCEVLRRCRERGVRVALDDFGTGYGSLAYLHRLPADAIKIDLEFVVNLPWNMRAFSIVAGTLQISQLSNIAVLAEGVETEEHGVRLLQMGCHHAQGFAIARALPSEEFEQWLKGWPVPASWKATAPTPPFPNALRLLGALVYHRAQLRALLPVLEATDAAAAAAPAESHESRCPLHEFEGAGIPSPLGPRVDEAHRQLHHLEQRATACLAAGRNPGPWLAKLLRRHSAIVAQAIERRLAQDRKQAPGHAAPLNLYGPRPQGGDSASPDEPPG